jgi:hypothetical protein
MLILSRAVIFLFFLSLALSGQATNSPLSDENKVLVFTFASSESSVIEKIDINTASLEDLIKIIHIGEVRAKELISLRPFSSLDELTKIKGIGQKKLEDIKKQGLAWVSIDQTPENSLGEVKLQLKEITPENKEIKKELTAVSEPFQQTQNKQSLVLLIASLLAIFSGIIILFLKKRVEVDYNKKV